MTATVHQALSALASELDLPASPPGCSKELQDRLQAFQLRTPSAEAAYAWMETQMFSDEPESLH